MREISVTKQAKEVFGDRIVKRAYVVDEYDEIDKNNIKFNDFDSNELVVEFNGGNKVKFCASEWLSIRAI